MSELKKYRKLPVVIEAIQFDGTGASLKAIREFIGQNYYGWSCLRSQFDDLLIKTLEGVMTANIGDYIIKGVNGEFYPCKPDIFEKTYEEVR